MRSLSREPFCGQCERIAALGSTALTQDVRQLWRAVRDQGFVTPAQWRRLDDLHLRAENWQRRHKGA